MKVRVRDLATAGLPREGIAKFYVEDVSEESGIDKNGNDFTRVDVTFRVLQYHNEEPLNSTPFIYDSFFIHNDSGFDKYINLYSGITGYVPDEGEVDPETGEPTFDTNDLHDDIRNQEVWGVVVYGDKQDNGKYRVNTGWSYKDSPSKVRLPRKLRNVKPDDAA